MIAACEKAVVFDYRILVIRVCAEFNVIRFFIALKYCLSTVVCVLQNSGIDYQHGRNIVVKCGGGRLV